MQTNLSIVRPDLFLDSAWQLRARHPLRHIAHLLPKHLSLLHLLTGSLHSHNVTLFQYIAVVYWSGWCFATVTGLQYSGQLVGCTKHGQLAV